MNTDAITVDARRPSFWRVLFWPRKGDLLCFDGLKWRVARRDGWNWPVDDRGAIETTPIGGVTSAETFVDEVRRATEPLGFPTVTDAGSAGDAVILKAKNDRGEVFWVTASGREIGMNADRLGALAEARVKNGFRTAFDNWMQREGNPRWREDQAAILRGDQ